MRFHRKISTFLLILIVCANLATTANCPVREHILPCRCLSRGEELQVWCSHSDLPRVLEGLKALAQYLFKPIDELILENNYLPSLPGRAFSSLKVMRLMLRHNSLERVSGSWLSGLEDSLMELYVVEPNLRSLPQDSLDRMNVLEAVTLRSNLMKRLPRFSGLQKLRYLQIESMSLIEVSPRNFRDIPALEKLHIQNSPHLTRLEAGLLRDSPNLTFVNVSFCGINWIHPRALTRLPVLKELSLMGNKLSDAAMIGRATRHLAALEILRLDYNSFDKLVEASFVDLTGLKKLYMSNNEITEIQQGAFHRVPLLRTLDLNYNLVKKVHPESFLQHSGSGLEELWLVHNDLGHVSELRAILDALPRLVFLDASHNSLEGIPFGALRGHATLERLHLDYNKLQFIEREAFMAMPALRELRLKNNSLSDLLDGPLWNLPGLKGLDLSGNFYRRVQRNLLDNLPSLRKIDLSANEINYVDPEAFAVNAALEQVNFSNNALESFHPAVFRNLVGLYELDVSHNRLVEFVPGLPRGLEYLHISGNSLINLPLRAGHTHLPALKMLDLNSNRLMRVPPNFLNALPQLRRLYLSQNFLEILEEDSLTGLNRLELLDVSYNRLKDVHPGALREMTELRELLLQNNRLTVLRPEIFHEIPRLKKLDVSSNKISEILLGTLENTRDIEIFNASRNSLLHLPPSLHGLKKLNILDVSDNKLKNIHAEMLTSLISLQELNISRNYLFEIRTGAFKQLQQLKYLHLDRNHIENVESESFHALPALKAIDLSQNKIKTIHKAVFDDLASLQILQLEENALSSVAVGAFRMIPRLLMLNLSYNHLGSLEEAGLKNVLSLEMLDLSSNRMTRITSAGLEKMEWLVELRADNNRICAVHGPAFNGMPRLRVLSLKNNKMMSFPEEAITKIRHNLAVFDLEGNPLACSCNLLWLQAWLQESPVFGPRCVDGTLLREIRISRDDCNQDETSAQAVAPGCEAELLSAPGTSQIIEQWFKRQNKTKLNFSNKNHLAPLPEESDYFYDDYVDYPYNETMITEPVHLIGNENVKQHKAASTSAPKTVKTNASSHFVAGDTPTIYAAPKNKTKTPPKVQGSPSSSGFTFFGLPLPTLNLNNLWGRTADVPLTIAERKSAIVNKPTHIDFPLYPHSIQPEFQTGFKPILPGTVGGFKPILNPLIQNISLSKRNDTQTASASKKTVFEATQPTSSSTTSKYMLQEDFFSSMGHPISTPKTTATTERLKTIEKSYGSEKRLETTKKNVGSEKRLETTEKSAESEEHLETTEKRRETVEKRPETIEKRLETTEKRLGTAEKRPEIIENHPVTNATKIQAALQIASGSKTILKTVSGNETLQAKNASTQIEIAADGFFDDFDIIDAVSPPPLIETTPKPVGNTTETKKDLLSTPLTGLLVPGGQQPQFRPGRPTVTKVQSPQSPLQSALEFPVNPLPYNREVKEAIPRAANKNEKDLSWYFANYNKTNLEPYVDKIPTAGSYAVKIETHKIVFMIPIIIFNAA